MLKILFFNKNKFLRFISTNVSHLISFAKPLPVLKLNDEIFLMPTVICKKNFKWKQDYAISLKLQNFGTVHSRMSSKSSTNTTKTIWPTKAHTFFTGRWCFGYFEISHCKSHSYYHPVKNNHPLTHFSPMSHFYTTWIPHISIRFQGV